MREALSKVKAVGFLPRNLVKNRIESTAARYLPQEGALIVRTSKYEVRSVCVTSHQVHVVSSQGKNCGT